MHQDDVQMIMDIKDSTIEATAWLSGDLKTYEVIPFETIEDCQFLAGYHAKYPLNQ